MPRTNDPLGILTGSGFAPPGSVGSSSITPGEVSPASGTLEAHVDAPTGAHPATAISITDPYVRYWLGPNVQGSLDELAALVPPVMGGVGSAGVSWLGSTNSGVPDWGILKLNDGIVPFTGNPAADARWVYPYYYRAPVCASGVGLTGTGLEVATDPLFNFFDGGIPAYTGGGTGLVHAGFATFEAPPGMGGVQTGYPTWRLLSAIADPAAVVSGIVAPADRGVLALVQWAAGGEATPAAPAASVADIQARCLAAILLGKGITESGGCDGFPGELFSEGTNGVRAQGQMANITNPAAGYTVTIDLTGLDGGPLTPSVFLAVAGAPATPLEFTVGGGAVATMLALSLAINTLYYSQFLYAEPDGAGGIKVYVRVVGTVGNTVTLATSCAPGDFVVLGCLGGVDGTSSPYSFPGRASGQFNLNELHRGLSLTGGTAPMFNPAAGQVRILTDPTAVTFAPATTTGGLPIFGATTYGIGLSFPVAWLPLSLGGGTDGNFFAYRLPYLADYNLTTGIHHTPTAEKTRFSQVLPPASAALATYGEYDDFTADFWAFQVARYRHRFELQTPPVGPLSRMDGNYALVHFKTEAFFEAYVRDGVVPTDAQVYSVNLVSWTGNTTPWNQLQNLATWTGISTANTMNRSEVVEDANGTIVPVPLASSFSLVATAGPTYSYYSGIPYYVPIDVTTAADPNVSITTLLFTYGGLFDNGYRSHDTAPWMGPLAGDYRAYILNQNPVFVSLSSFSYEGDEVGPTSTIASTSLGLVLFPGSLGQFRRQRIEFGYADLTPAATADPVLADLATYFLGILPPPLSDGIYFTGDTTTPAFTQDARVRVFVRRPLVIDAVTGYAEPRATLGTNIPSTGGVPILYHSMREGAAAVGVPYGNANNPAIAGYTTLKDTEERFLDEVYRYPQTWNPLAPPDSTQLQGPGLPLGAAAIQVPVRPVAPNYTGWYLTTLHLSPLDNVGGTDLGTSLQVAGLPARDPSYTEGLTSPFPSRGVLIYPQTDYTGYDPVGTDYSVLTGDRSYVRAFDAGAANVGASAVTFRLWGVALTDFAYTPVTGPGALGMAVMVKVPGLTTWMDAGRVDGAGPGKQDIALDGAGCLTVSAEGTDVTSQLYYTDITVNLGPAALFLNAEVPGRCPVLVKVILKDNATGKALDFANVAETAATNTCRGLVGIDLT